MTPETTRSVARQVERSADPVRYAQGLMPLAPDTTLVVPSDAAAHALGLARAPATLARIARSHARRHGRLASAVTRRRLLQAACAAVFSEDDALGYATRGALAVATWLRAGVPSVAPGGLSERNRRWWCVARRYQQALRAQGTIDPVEAPRLIAERPPPATALVVVGYPTFDPDEIALLDALAGPGSRVVLPWHEGWTGAADAASEALVERGWALSHHDATPPAPVAAVHRAPTLEDEVRSALAEVKRTLLEDALEPSQVALVTRDVGRYADELRSVARAYGVPLRLERRVPLRRSPLGAYLATMIEVLADGFPFEPSAALLRHPFCGLLDQAAFDRARRWRPRGLSAWRRAVRTSAEAVRAEAALAALAPLATPRSRPRGLTPPGDAGAYRQAIDTALTATLHPDAVQTLAPTLLAWRRALADALPPGVDGLDHGTVLRLLRETLRVVTVPDDLSQPVALPDGTAPGSAASGRPERAAAVRVVAPEALAGTRLASVLLLGAAEGMLPAPVQDPPLFDAFDRDELRAAGVPVASPADLAQRERLAMWGVWRAAGRLWIAYPEQTGRDARLPSALLDELGASPRALPRRRPASPSERLARDLARNDLPHGAWSADPILSAARHALEVERSRERSSLRDAFDGVLGQPFDAGGWRWSASQLTSFGQCRFRWLAQSAWGVRMPPEGESEVTPLLRGSLYHHALAGALQAAVGKQGEAAREAAEAALEGAFEAAERRTAAGAVTHWRHLREEHLRHLRELLRHASFLPDGHEVLLLEREFRGAWHGLEVAGRVDRIDRTAAGAVVIDYKTGSGRPLGARGFDATRLDLDLQLPLYLEVAAPQLLPHERLAGARYYSLGAMREIPREAPDRAETTDFVTRLRRTLAAGDFPVEPSEACRTCDLETACRKGPRLAYKRGPRRPEGPDASGADHDGAPAGGAP